MATLIRRIDMKKWPDDGPQYSTILELPAEPITRDMNSRLNTFSLWKFSRDEYLEAGLTIALSLGKEIDTIEIIFLDGDSISDCGLTVENNDGETCYHVMKCHHYDIINMNHDALGKVADLIIKNINDGNFEICMKDELLDLLIQRMDEGIIEKKHLNKSVKKQVEKLLKEIAESEIANKITDAS